MVMVDAMYANGSTSTSYHTILQHVWVKWFELEQEWVKFCTWPGPCTLWQLFLVKETLAPTSFCKSTKYSLYCKCNLQYSKQYDFTEVHIRCNSGSLGLGFSFLRVCIMKIIVKHKGLVCTHWPSSLMLKPRLMMINNCSPNCIWDCLSSWSSSFSFSSLVRSMVLSCVAVRHNHISCILYVHLSAQAWNQCRN